MDWATALVVSISIYCGTQLTIILIALYTDR